MKKIYSLLVLFLPLFSLAQTFSVTLTTDSIARDKPGRDLYIDAEIRNLTASPIYIDAIRLLNTAVPNWYTTICLDVCFNPFTDSGRVYIPAGAKQRFEFTFYTDASPDSSHAIVKIKNAANAGEFVVLNLYAVTDSTFNGVNDLQHAASMIAVFPNPFRAFTVIEPAEYLSRHAGAMLSLSVFDELGNEVYRLHGLRERTVFERGTLASGIYFYRITDEHKTVATGRMAIE